MTSVALIDRRNELLAEIEDKHLGALDKFAPRGIDGAFYIANLRLYISENPKLLSATPNSIIAGLLHVAQSGLVLGESCDLLTFKDKGVAKAVFFIRAAGVVEMAYASGVQSFQAFNARQGDRLTWTQGSAFRWELVQDHKPNAEITDSFAVAMIRPSAWVGHRMTRAEIMAHKAKFALKPETKRAELEDVPWYGPKTCVHQIKRWIPKNARFAFALSLSREPEDAVEADFEVVGSKVPDALQGEHAPVPTREPGEEDTERFGDAYREDGEG